VTRKTRSRIAASGYLSFSTTRVAADYEQIGIEDILTMRRVRLNSLRPKSVRISLPLGV
jgi:hypothetical protein